MHANLTPAQRPTLAALPAPPPARCLAMAATLRPYLAAIRHTLRAALCLQDYPSEQVPRLVFY